MLKYASGTVFYFCVLALMLYCCGYFNLDSFNFGPKSLLNWDAFWYDSIRKEGYKFLSNRTCNLAFFPLFPAIWKISKLAINEICIANFFVFIVAFGILSTYLRITRSELLFFLGTSSFIFFALPYSESLFFLFATFIILGYKKNNHFVLCTGLFLASLTRAVTIIFIPLIIVTEILDKGKCMRQKIINIFLNISVSLLGMLISAGVQYSSTGKMFYFLQVQKYWKRGFVLPKIPFTTYLPDQIIFLDAISMAIGLVAIYILMLKLVSFCFKRDQEIEITRDEIFSVSYISIVTLLDIFFTFHDHGKTNIWSLNRHILCTPFYIVFIIKLLRSEVKKTRLYIILSIIISAFFITETPVYFPMAVLFMFFFFQLYMVRRNLNFYLIVFFSIPNAAVQIYLFVQFMHGGWVG